MTRNFIIILFLSFISTSIVAQETIFEEARTIYKKEQTLGVTLHTRGWGITYRYGKYTTGFSRRFYEGEIVGLKHPKEIKSFSSIFDNSNGYVFGKLNGITLFRASIGTNKTFVSKQSVRGIAISYILNGGVSIAYAKPVYLEVVKVDENTGLIYSNVERYNPAIHNQGDILGKGPWGKGLFNGKFYPGLLVKAGLNFEYAKQASKINSIELGVALDAFLQDLPIMANEYNHQIIYNLYLTVAFGAKKTE